MVPTTLAETAQDGVRSTTQSALLAWQRIATSPDQARQQFPQTVLDKHPNTTTHSGRSPGNAVPPNTNVRKGGFDPAGTLTWETQVGFFTQWDSPPWMAVLGQDGFFDRFTIAMSHHSQALAITDREDFDDRHPPVGI
jgi:hypothetical protein